MFSMITNIYNKKTPNAYAEPSTLLFSTSIAPWLQFPLISSDYAEDWPEPVHRHLQRLMGDHLISACTDTQFQ
jgi:chloramphenicol O-acetyltransferase